MTVRCGMIRPWLAALVLVTGCSLLVHSPHAPPPASRADCPSRVFPVLDTVGALGMAVLTGEAYAHRDDKGSNTVVLVVPLAVFGAAAAASAVYGYVIPGRCERSFAP
jgi:hypothetical protein